MADIYDSVLDSPTNTFATLNSLDTAGTTSTPLNLSEGNLRTVHSVTGQHQGVRGTISVSSGIWYFEVVIVQVPSGTSQNYSTGFYNANVYNSLHYLQEGNLSFGAYGDNAEIFVNTSRTSYGSIGSNGSIYMFCLDADNEKFWVGLDGNWFASGNPSTGANPSASGFGKANWSTYQSHYKYSGGNNGSFHHNYGQDSSFGANKTTGSANATDANGIGDFYYSPPTGALALCTSNLPASSIDVAVDDAPEDYFKAVIWTGQQNGGAYNNGNVTVGFQPDLVWIKAKETGYAQLFNDSLRGTGVELRGNETGVQIARTDGFTAFNPTGFSVGTNAAYNDSSKGMVSWNWKAGGAPDLTSSPTKPFAKDNVQYTDTTSNKATVFGSASNYTITPTSASIGVKQGFSIIKYSGNGSIPHGLSSPLDFLIVKNLDLAGENWTTWHSSFSSGDYVYLNLTQQKYNSTGKFSGVPTSTVFQVGADNSTGSSSYNYIAYCFTSIEGYSAFGSYEGNAAGPNGPFIYTGFRVAFLMIKNIDSSGPSWDIYDNAREPFNDGSFANLSANSSGTEGSRSIDFLSNGFKIKETNSWNINSSETFIYACWAEMPQKYAVAR